MASPKLRAYGLVWPILGRLGRLDPSSNLGTPTTLLGVQDAVHPNEMVSELSFDKSMRDFL